MGGSEVSFVVWAPLVKRMKLELLSLDGSRSRIEMKPQEKGYFSTVTTADEGSRYSFLLNGKLRRPDPASRFQPEGVHRPSAVIYPDNFTWQDRSWRGIKKSDLIIYEIHVGTFSDDGTFESVITHLGYLKDLGITAIEIMPVGQFSGDRNWGYDVVDIFAPQNSYGGPNSLKKLVNACHLKGISVILDVVYNHVGPEGNYLGDFGPYFSHKYTTPWGPAFNYDDFGSDEVRKFVVQNAIYWIDEFHMDGLRLDAVDKIIDSSPKHIVQEIAERIGEFASVIERSVQVIAECDLNDPKVIRSTRAGGYSVDAKWSDDFHHSVHSYLTGERYANYSDFGEPQRYF